MKTPAIVLILGITTITALLIILYIFTEKKGSDLNALNQSIIPSQYNLSTLQRALQDKTRSPEKKASVFFEMCAHHIKPGMSSKDLFSVVGSSDLFENVDFLEMGFQSSGPEVFPGGLDSDNTSIIAIKPFSKGKHNGSLLFWFSGPISPDDFLAIFNNTFVGTTKLLGFAIDMPHPLEPETTWRVEISTENAFRVIEYW